MIRFISRYDAEDLRCTHLGDFWEELAELPVAKVELDALLRQQAFLVVAGLDRAKCRRALAHEALKAEKDRARAPRRIPRLRVEVANRKAQSGVCLESRSETDLR